ncbi:MAG TPA: 30S ribosomal protein S16 [Longimicrobiaceae bacterium]|jgi:small subunit ribosomal protein S16
MALKIRLRRMGRKKAPHYRIVVAESSFPRDGRFVANVGHYNPTTNPATLVVDRDKALAWIGKGAMPTDTVQSLFKQAGVFKEPSVVEDAVAAAGGVASKAAGAVKGAAGKVAETATSAVAAVAETAASAASTVVEAVRDAASSVAERVTGGGDEGGEAAPAATEGDAAPAEGGEAETPAAPAEGEQPQG